MGNKLPLEEDNVMKRVCNEFNNSKFNSALVLAEFKGQMAVATMNTLHMNAIMNALGQMAQQANAQIDDNMKEDSSKAGVACAKN